MRKWRAKYTSEIFCNTWNKKDAIFHTRLASAVCLVSSTHVRKKRSQHLCNMKQDKYEYFHNGKHYNIERNIPISSFSCIFYDHPYVPQQYSHNIVTLFNCDTANLWIASSLNGDQMQYSFVLMQKSLPNLQLHAMGKIQKNI